MIAEYKRKTNLFVGIGLLLQIGGALLGRHMEWANMLVLPGVFVYMYGLYFYAKSKGYSGWFAVFGLLNLLGLIILVLLPDKRKQG